MKDKKTILVALALVIVAAAVFFNIERFTGQATKSEMTKLYVSSKADIMSEVNPTVDKGEYIYFTEIPGSEGGSGTLYVREMESGRKWGKIVRTQVFDHCNSRKCNPGQVGELKFKTYYNWEGEYCGEIKDLDTWKEVKTCFTVK